MNSTAIASWISHGKCAVAAAALIHCSWMRPCEGQAACVRLVDADHLVWLFGYLYAERPLRGHGLLNLEARHIVVTHLLDLSVFCNNSENSWNSKKL